MTSTIYLDTHFNVGKIDRRIFGGFLEHLGRAVYEGVYDPGNEHGLVDENGFRTDVLDALRPMGMPVVRYPGGNFVSAYNWRNGIGPRDKRPRRPDFAWRSMESNQFGTDEFMTWCKAIKTEPMMAVNLGTASGTDAAELLEYCNMPTGTLWADQRAANGHAEPYNVKLWCLGNEMDGPWQAGHVPAGVYAQRAREAAALMKGLDKSIETIACGSSGREMSTYLAYDREVLEHCWDHVEYISAHRYSNNRRNDCAWFLAEGVEIDRVIADYAGLLDYVRGVKKSDKRIYVSFDEWNVWYKTATPADMDGHWTDAPHLLEEQYNVEDALVCAQYLSAFLRRADVVKIACIAQIVNVIAPIMTRPDGVLIQPTYYPFVAFAQHARGIALTPTVQSPSYTAGERGDVPVIDASASFDPVSGDVAVFVVNRDVKTPQTITIRLADRTVDRVSASDVLTGEPKATNTWQSPEQVHPTQLTATITADGHVLLAVPGGAFATIRLRTS